KTRNKRKRVQRSARELLAATLSVRREVLCKAFQVSGASTAKATTGAQLQRGYQALSISSQLLHHQRFHGREATASKTSLQKCFERARSHDLDPNYNPDR